MAVNIFYTSTVAVASGLPFEWQERPVIQRISDARPAVEDCRTKFRLEVFDKFARGYILLNKSGKDFCGGTIRETFACSFEYEGMVV